MKRTVYYLSDKVKRVIEDWLKTVEYDSLTGGFACVINFNEMMWATDIKDVNEFSWIAGFYIINNMDDVLFETSGFTDVIVLRLNKYLNELIQMDAGSIIDAKYPDMLSIVIEDETEEHANLIKRFNGYTFSMNEEAYTYTNVFVEKTNNEMYKIRYQLQKAVIVPYQDL